MNTIPIFNVSSEHGLQRARGRAEVGFTASGDKTKLVHLHQSGCLKAFLPRNHGRVVDTVFVNTSGGMTGGDRLSYQVDVGEGAEACITSQTAERVYRSVSGTASVTVDLQLGRGARIDWIPQETILFDGGALARDINISMPDDACVLAFESIVLGRHAMGENIETCSMSDRWQIRRGGRLVFVDAVKIQSPPMLKGPAALGDSRALATLVYVGSDIDPILARVRALDGGKDVVIAASAWNGCLFVRMVSPTPQALREMAIHLLGMFRSDRLPRVWTM